MHRQGLLRRAALLGAFAALLLSVLTVTPQASAATGGGGDTLTIISDRRPSPSQVAAECRPNSRVLQCWQDRFEIDVKHDDELIGQVFIAITQTITLNIKSTKFSERFSLRTEAKTWGATDGILSSLDVSCGRACKAHPKGLTAKLLRKRKIIRGKVDYSSKVAKGRVRNGKPSYILQVFKPGFTLGVLPWTAPAGYRCDDQIKDQRAGCVFPSVQPTLTTMNRLQFISQNIRSLQRRGAPTVLHRNSRLTDSNRKAICGPARLPQGWQPPAGWPLPLTDPNNRPSCDEYAFAGTNEGGAKPNNGYAWVPRRENNRQGGLLNAFYKQNRVLDAASARTRGDAFKVVV